jgi:hypothetical protein
MRHILASFALVAALAAPAALHAETITGQFSLDGTVINSGSTLTFLGAPKTGIGTQTGVFATLLTNNEAISYGPSVITYSPYVDDSAKFGVGRLNVTLDTLVATNIMLNGSLITAFSGDATFSAAGYQTTMGTFSFSTQASGPVTFSATGISSSPVPEPSSLALFGTGALGIGLLGTRKFVG